MLHYELVRLVAERDVTHATVAAWLGVSRPAVTLALAGKNLLSKPAIEVLCNRLDRAELFPRLASLLVTARGCQTTPGARAGHAAPRDTELVIGLEAFAEQITVFDPWRVPVHMQTAEYAAALGSPNSGFTQRQAQLTSQDDPLAVEWLTVEHVFQRRTGSAEVMHNQLAFLLTLADRPNITIRVIPETIDLPSNGSSFQIIWGPPHVVVEPGHLATRYAHEPETVNYFAQLLDDIQRRALNPEASVVLIAGLAQ